MMAFLLFAVCQNKLNYEGKDPKLSACKAHKITTNRISMSVPIFILMSQVVCVTSKTSQLSGWYNKAIAILPSF